MSAQFERTRHPGIYRRGGRYVVMWRHRGRQHKQSFRTLDEAREAKGLRDSGESRPASRERFEEYARRWLDGYSGRTARGIAPRTLQSYRGGIERYAIPHFRDCRLVEVEPPPDVRAFVQQLEHRGIRPATIRRVLAPVRAMFATAVEDGTLRYNPCAGIRVAGRRDLEPTREIRALTREELARLLGELPEEWRLLFEFLAHTGLRISEAIALEWRDIEFGARPRVKVRRQHCRGEVGELKSEHSRRDVPLSPGMARRLWTARARSSGTVRLFTGPRGAPLSDGNVRTRVLGPARQRAGLEWVGFHSFRHTCASLLFDAGRDVKVVQEWLGHADPGFTLRTYIHLLDKGVGDADFFDQAVAVGGNRVGTGHPETAANGGVTEGASLAS